MSVDFDAFVREMSPPLTRYCAAVTGGGDAEDAAQEAFIRLWRNLPKIRDEAAARAFVYRAAYRVCVDIIRRRKRFREPQKAVAGSNSLSEGMISALLTLTPCDRALIYGRAVEETDYAELAALYGKNEAWARKRCSLAKKKLEKLLTQKEKNYD